MIAVQIQWRKASRFVIARPQRGRGNLGEAVAISPEAFLLSGRVLRDCHVGLRPPRNDTSGECSGAPAPFCGLIIPYRAVTDRRYRRNRFPHCSDSLFRTQVPRAQKQAALLRPVRKICNYSAFGPAATSALPASLPSYLTKFLTKREARSFAFSSHWEASA